MPLAWARLLAAHAELTRPMDAKLRASHGLTISDYEVLLWLSWAPEGRLRRVELARAVHLTQGGVTRLLAGLEQAGLVESARASADRRVVYTQLTDAGRDRLTEAARTHVADITERVTERLSAEELATLARLLGRLTDAPDRRDAPGARPRRPAARGDAASPG